MVKRSDAWGPPPNLDDPISQPCTHDQLEHEMFQLWRERLREPSTYNRKVWEWVWICEALDRHQREQDGRSLELVGFGVGTEPIVGWQVAGGNRVLATDLPAADSGAEAWNATNQHAATMDALDPRAIASHHDMNRLVEFRPVDMRALPEDLGQFDAMWSSCAIEHLGSIQAGFDFVRAALRHCRPGAVALHTTELNVSHTRRTVASGGTVVYRRSDLESFFAELRAEGHRVDATFNLGSHPLDGHIDHPPYSSHHLKVPVGPVVATSFGFAIHVG